jgi:lantibiotic biosynthesis protein
MTDGFVDAGLADAALLIGRTLCGSAHPAEGGCSWTAPVVLGIDGERAVVGLGEIGPSLYDGSAGVAWALAACARASPEDRFADRSRAAIGHALTAADTLVDDDRLGLFDGAAGVAWAAAVVGQALGDEAIRQRGRVLVQRIHDRLDAAPDRDETDLIGGTAGILLGLAACAACASTAPPTAANLSGHACAVAAAAQPQTWGAAWRTGASAADGPPLLGMGHGAAGIVLALAETGVEEVRQACVAALEYERSWFDPALPAWPDLRNFRPGTDTPSAMTAWCHGAIGIGLSRVRLTALSPDPHLYAEATAALQAARNLTVDAGTALRGGIFKDCTPCHGLAGVAELMLVSARGFEEDSHRHAARRVAGLMIEQHAAKGEWPCGLPGAGEVPAMMTGTAGIALTLLRAAGTSNLPTPLLPGPSGW